MFHFGLTELAHDIIALYPEFVNLVDEHGYSPLHTLASKPSCFKSGTYKLARWDKLMYKSKYFELPPSICYIHKICEINSVI